ncbi:nucleotidyltransferase family protein [Polyangium jinanense]|uniref:Nucleotidyltransferase family protein n=1 Tax=Polyangium jinanense TaxID=2829994 RepID=A0A9X3X9W9_9BACT|nr:nucleotidyltransferase family protein [Polyangium jinanense]MDC3959409.1 nucleotidyltransferase family protein [Polyangium jinanense]MDC3984843.1 nucleotidyltransferase family protein [Polyangium jinanense]
MKAIVLAGGKGSRLKPYTALIPKPLMPIGEQTIVEILLRQLALYGVNDVTLCTGHQAGLIEAVLGEGSRYGVKLSYRREEQPLGTIGPLRAIAHELPERFLVMNGDILCDLDFAELAKRSAEANAPLTVCVFERATKIDLGVLELDPEGSVTGFREKPTYSFWVSMGIYAMSRETLLRFVPEGVPFGFDQLMHALLAARVPIQTHPFRGHWLDIGRSDDFAEAQDEFERNRPRYLPEPKA